MQKAEKESKEIKPRRGGAREGAGRPAGVPNKITQPIKELAASYSPASIAKLVELLNGAESEQVQFAAAKELLDRAHGRARQELELTGDKSITVVVQRLTPQPTMLEIPPVLPEGTESHDHAN